MSLCVKMAMGSCLEMPDCALDYLPCWFVGDDNQSRAGRSTWTFISLPKTMDMPP